MTHKSGSAAADTYSYREQEVLGRYNSEGKLRYRDLEAGYCTACSTVYGVECPRCHASAGAHGRNNEDLFRVEHPLQTDTFQGQAWTLTECSKCSFKFRVLIQPLH